MALAIAGCSSTSDLAVNTGTGTLYGTISNSSGALAGVTVVVTPVGSVALPAVTTTNAGTYRVAGIDVSTSGSGTVAVSGLPTNCTVPAAASYNGLHPNDSVRVNVAVTCTPPTGSLNIVVNAPVGVTPSVTVAGPNGYTRNLSASQTLTALVAGNYTVTAATVEDSNAIVATVDTATVSVASENVTSGTTVTDSVNYTARVGTGALWVANNQGSHAFVDYTAAQLSTSGSPTPTLAASVAAAGASANAMAFDAHGNLWVIASSSNQILEYSAAQLTSGTPAATVTINDVNGVGVNGIAFDAHGNLWLANYEPCEIDELSAAQLASASGSATLTPAMVLNGCGANVTVTGPSALTFDANGNLWVADIDSSDVYMYQASVLTGTGAVTSEPTFQTRPGIPVQSLAFDGGGNLWTSGGDQVVRLSASQLASGGSGSPATATPSVSLTVSGASFEGLAFDDSGDLWAVDNTNAAVVELSASQLASSGTITPTTNVSTTSGSMNAPWSLAFNPHPTSLPQPITGPGLSRRRK